MYWHKIAAHPIQLEEILDEIFQQREKHGDLREVLIFEYAHLEELMSSYYFSPKASDRFCDIIVENNGDKCNIIQIRNPYKEKIRFVFGDRGHLFRLFPYLAN